MSFTSGTPPALLSVSCWYKGHRRSPVPDPLKRPRGRPPKPLVPPSPVGVRDYRTWVRRLIAFALKGGAFPDGEHLAAAAGVHGSTLSNIKQRKRHAGEDLLRRLAYTLGLGAERTALLLWWRREQTAKRATERNRARAEKRAIVEALGDEGLIAPLEHESVLLELERGDPLSTWLGAVLRALAQCPNFKSEPKLVYKALRGVAPPRAIADTLAAMEAHGRLVRTSDGELRPRHWLLLNEKAAAPPSRATLEETVFRAREALLTGELGAAFGLRVGAVPTETLDAWGREALRGAEAIDPMVDASSAVVVAGQPAPDLDLPPAEMVLQLALALLILRPPAASSFAPFSTPPPQPLATVRSMEPPRRSPGYPEVYDFVRPGEWLRAALRANQGTGRPCTLKALVEAGVLSRSRLRYLVDPSLGRRYPLDDQDLARMAGCFLLSPDDQLFLARVVGFWQVPTVQERRARLDEIVGTLETVAERRGDGPAFRSRSRLSHLLARALMGHGLDRPETLAVALGLPLDQGRDLRWDLRRAGLGPGHGGFVELPDPARDFVAMRLLDDALLWLGRNLDAHAEKVYYHFFHGAAPAGRTAALARAQQALLDGLVARPSTRRQDPWVPVLALRLVHPISRALSRR